MYIIPLCSKIARPFLKPQYMRSKSHALYERLISRAGFPILIRLYWISSQFIKVLTRDPFHLRFFHHSSNLVEIRFTVVPPILNCDGKIVISPYFFAHATTAQLPCHVIKWPPLVCQNLDERKIEFPSHFNCNGKTLMKWSKPTFHRIRITMDR